MIDTTGFEPYRISGKTLISTDSRRIIYQNENNDQNVEIATFSSTSNRCIEIDASGWLYLIEGSSYSEVNLNEQHFKTFKIID